MLTEQPCKLELKFQILFYKPNHLQVPNLMLVHFLAKWGVLEVSLLYVT